MWPFSDCTMRSAWFLSHPKTTTTSSWLAKPPPVPIYRWVLPCSAGLVCSNVWFWFLGFSIYSCIQISYCQVQNIDFGTSLSFFDILTTSENKIDSDTFAAASRKWPSMECQWLLILHHGYGKQYMMTALTVPVVINLQMNKVQAAPALSTFGELLETLGIVPWKSLIPQWTSQLCSVRWRYVP